MILYADIPGERLDAFLARSAEGLSRSAAQKLLESGQVTCGGKILKAIIETCLLTDEEKAIATRLSCEAGAHFVKTCTGVSVGVATVADVQIMKANLSGSAVIKASAGIRTYEDAKALIEAGASRIGTSAGISIIESAAKA